MIRFRFFGAAFLALSLGVSLSAHAQAPAAPLPAQVTPQTGATGGPQGGQPNAPWSSNESFDRQQFREEMEQIRKEHDDLEAAEDKLLDTCVNAKPPRADECEKEKQSLHDRRAKLHERMHALHEKMEEARREHDDRRPDGQPGPGLEMPLPPPPAQPTSALPPRP